MDRAIFKSIDGTPIARSNVYLKRHVKLSGHIEFRIKYTARKTVPNPQADFVDKRT